MDIGSAKVERDMKNVNEYNINMELGFLTIGEYQIKEYYLQHISEMINVKLEINDTYNILFEKLRSHFKDNEERLKAAEVWIAFNIEQQEDVSVFETVLCEEEDCYAAFDLRQ